MDRSVVNFYDGLSSDYHLLFEDWWRTVRWQGEVLDQLIRSRLGRSPEAVLDCCCGIGTQAIGLALRVLHVHGTDVSAAAITRAAREAVALGVSVTFGVADVRDLAQEVGGHFDVVLACDNALPHLLSDDHLQQGVHGMAARLCKRGLFLASIRDYDALVQQRPRTTTPKVIDDRTGRRVVLQVWDWAADGRTYLLQQFILRESPEGWRTTHHTTYYRALLREELGAALQRAGLIDVRWHMPEESGYYQPVVTARNP
jgi:2-polyprenyl-3-methyl-5-hydroxy-6-metoxy-1,4-benzoquinol methylase